MFHVFLLVAALAGGRPDILISKQEFATKAECEAQKADLSKKAQEQLPNYIVLADKCATVEEMTPQGPKPEERSADEKVD